MIQEKLGIPGLHRALIPGPMGVLELVLDVPLEVDPRYLAILGHPHSLQGGTMDNKVVTTMARAFRELGVASIRFNFRGVGQSEGVFAEGVGESEDMLHILRLCDRPGLRVWFAGFSFGSYVTFRALTQYQAEGGHSAGLISIAPSVDHYDYATVLEPKTPWLIIIADEDEIVPAASISEFARTHPNAPTVVHFADTSHFFHSKLLDLRAVLQKHLHTWLLR